MYDSFFQDEANTAIRDRIARPIVGPLAEPGPFANFWGAVKGAAAVAPLEMSRAATSIAQAYGKAAEPQNRAMMKAIDPETLSRMDQHQEVDIQAPIRKQIERFTPDPASTGTASRIVFGAGKVLGKAIGYGVAGGVPGAVLGTGIDEGINETLRLTDQGVDLATAAKVGAVHGVATAAGIAAPVAGKTIAQTAALVVGSGPGLFVGENLAAREILDAANYSQIAKQYDPYDIVGLAVSLVPSAAMGAAAHAMRGARARARTVPALTPTAEELAAAHQVLAADQVMGSALAKSTDAAALNAHVDGMEATARALDRQEIVSVTDQVVADPQQLHAVAERARAHLTPEVIDQARAAERELDATRGMPNVTEAEAMSTLVAPKDPAATRLFPTGELDEQGLPVMRSVDEIAQEADVALKDKPAFEAAIKCFLAAA